MPRPSIPDISSPADAGFPATRSRAEGGDAAFRLLLERWSRLVSSTALRHLNGDREAAREVAQNVFLAAFRKGQLPHTVKSPAAWFHRVALLQAANHLRAERRRIRHMEAWAAEQSVNPAGEPPHIPEDLRARLDEELNRLRDADRELVLGRFYEGRPFQELAKLRGGTPDAVRVKLNRVLEKLAAALRRRGVAVTAVSLGSALGAQWTHAAPAGFSSALTAATAGGASVIPTKVSLLLTAMSSAKSITLTTAALLLAGVSLHSQSARNGELRATVARLSAPAARSVPKPASTPGANSPSRPPREKENVWQETGPVTAARLLRDERDWGNAAKVVRDMSYPCDERVKALSAEAMEALLSTLENTPGGAALKSRARTRLLRFMADKDPVKALGHAARLKLPAAAYTDLAARWAARGQEGDSPAMLAFLEKPDAFPPGKYGTDPAASFREGITRALAEKNLHSALQLCRTAAGTEAAEAFLTGAVPALIKAGKRGVMFDLLEGVAAPSARDNVLCSAARAILREKNPKDLKEFFEDPRVPAERRRDLILQTADQYRIGSAGGSNTVGAVMVIVGAASEKDGETLLTDWLRRSVPPRGPHPEIHQDDQDASDMVMEKLLETVAAQEPALAKKWLPAIINKDRRAALAGKLDISRP